MEDKDKRICKTCRYYTHRKTSVGILHRCTSMGASWPVECNPDGACIHPQDGWKPRSERPSHQNEEFWWLDSGEPLTWEEDD